MRGRSALLGLGISAAAVGAAYASAFLPAGAPGWAPWLMAGGTAGALVAAMALGAARAGRIGRLAYPFAFVFLALVVGFGLALGLPSAEAAEPALWLGLPPRAAVVMYGIGFLPLLVVPLAYALTFDELTLSSADWERIRRAAAGADAEGAPSAMARPDAAGGPDPGGEGEGP